MNFNLALILIYNLFDFVVYFGIFDDWVIQLDDMKFEL